MWNINKRLILSTLCALAVLSGCTPTHKPARTAAPQTPKPKPTDPQGQSLSPFTFLRKISLHIRGRTPERSEYEALTQALEKGRAADFFQQKLDSYLTSDEHIDKMTFRLEELLGLAASGVPYYSPNSIEKDYDQARPEPLVRAFAIRNSLNQLVREIVSRNLSWDNLLTAKRYTAYPIKNERFSFDMSDLMYFAAAAGTPVRSETPVAVRFSDDDPRPAGVLTTSRFFGRYVNTALNKNRRRAAAVFRAFLCDDMKAVVVNEQSKQGEILDLVFPGQHGGGNTGPRLGMTDSHGSDPACMKCHYKLDPMGRTFQDSGLVLAPLASAGALVFTDHAGRKVDRPVKGLAELGAAIVEQEDFARCQVRHFWRWFIGEDRELTEPLLAELTARFNEVRRRPNDFIGYLLNRPEFGFAMRTGSVGVLVSEVKGILRNCNGCHSNQGIPSFTEWPIGGDPARHARWLANIRGTLSLDGSTRPRSMPPERSSWQPTADQLASLQKWFDMGAPNE